MERTISAGGRANLGRPIYGGFWCRAVAGAIDGAIISVLMSIFGIFYSFGIEDLFGQIFTAAANAGASEAQFQAIVVALFYKFAFLMFISFIVSWIYSALFESSQYRGTPGKIYMGINVTTVSGGKLTFLQATIRYIMKNISLAFLGLGYLMQPFNVNRQAFHDLVASCVVVENKPADTQHYLFATIFSIFVPLFVSIILTLFGVIF